MPKHQKLLENGLISPEGTLRSGTCVWFVKNVDGKNFVLVQKRAKTVHNGGFFDVSAGGHVDDLETPLEGAIRETKEEIGVDLTPDELRFLCAYRVEDKIVFIYLSDRTEKDDLFTLDPEEVESLEWVEEKDLGDFFSKNLKPNLKKDTFHLGLLKEALKNLNGSNESKALTPR